jgi:ParB family transcriptional regulator, chromosome partitioning protein
MAIKRKALGKGLNALLPSAPSARSDRSLVEIPLDQIIPNKYQPRTNFDREQLQELSKSIQSNGVVQPVIVRRSGLQYQLIAGERRWRAAGLAGLKTIPAVVQEASEYKTLELALVENIQRQDLNPIEEASAYSTLISDFDLTQEEIALRVGKDRSSVANYLRLLKLPDEIRQKIENGTLSMGHARAILGLDSSKEQLVLAERILSEGLNVRQTEQLIRHWKPGKGRKRPRPDAPEAQDPNVKAAQRRLEEQYGTRVLINTNGEKGVIEIYFHNAQDLMRIYDLLISGGTK